MTAISLLLNVATCSVMFWQPVFTMPGPYNVYGVNGAARIGQPSKGSLRLAMCTWGYLHSAMRIVQVPRFQAFRIPSLAIGESTVYHELLHDTFTLYVPSLQGSGPLW